jgi:cytosine permease
MGLIWLSMVTGSPAVLAGFAWCGKGFSLFQVLVCTFISSLILLIYSVPANHLGARSGLSYSILSESVFGRLGSYVVRINLLWVFLFWYGWIALFVGVSAKGIYGMSLPTAVLGAFFAIAMAVPNFFGFTGVANVSRYLSAPILITWVAFCFFKAARNVPQEALWQNSHADFATAITVISSFVIGFAIWGNEPDYWRHSRPRKLFSGLAVFISLLIGQVIFPMTGWMLSKISGISEAQPAFRFLNEYSLASIPFLAFLVLLSDNGAANDSNLFGLITALRSLRSMTHKTAVVVLAIAGALVAASLSALGTVKSLEQVASLNCVIVPTPTVIMLAEWYLSKRYCGQPFFATIVPFDQLQFIRWPALIALAIGIATGVLTSGVIPGTEALHVGICSVQAWLAALLVYIPLRQKELAKTQPITLQQAPEPVD